MRLHINVVFPEYIGKKFEENASSNRFFWSLYWLLASVLLPLVFKLSCLYSFIVVIRIYFNIEPSVLIDSLFE